MLDFDLHRKKLLFLQNYFIFSFWTTYCGAQNIFLALPLRDLFWWCLGYLDRVLGFEPWSTSCKANALLLSYLPSLELQHILKSIWTIKFKDCYHNSFLFTTCTCSFLSSFLLSRILFCLDSFCLDFGISVYFKVFIYKIFINSWVLLLWLL